MSCRPLLPHNEADGHLKEEEEMVKKEGEQKSRKTNNIGEKY
jgi:hypothetical protein